MFERRYRERLEGDLARWEAAGLISPASGGAIRAALGPLPKGIDLATVVAIVGGLLIAAAFLAFVAANWEAIARPARFAILLAGVASAYGLGAWFDRDGRTVLADLCASAGSIVFGAAIALTGQMYHLAGDFAGGMMLWAVGALVAAALTGSRGALAVALAAGCVWSGMRVYDDPEYPHLAFVAFWLAGAALAVLWNAPVARHLVGAAAISWWVAAAFALAETFGAGNPVFIMGAGAALLLGAGLALANWGPEPLRALGMTLSTYAAFLFAAAVTLTVAGAPGSGSRNLPVWSIACAGVGVVLAFAAAALKRGAGPALAGVALGLGLAVMSVYAKPTSDAEPWAAYALALAAMLSLVVSGMIDDVRPRVVAGWLGLAAVIAAITWAVKGSLLRRALFLAVAGAAAVALAILLGRLSRKEAAS